MALAATPQQQQFLTTYQPYAQDAGKQLGVDPNVILGQWAHETGFGTNLGTQHNNLGGMTAPTGQYYSYSDPQQFTDHYVQTLQSKYPQVLGTGSNANKFVTGLYQGHYFTGNPGDYVADVNNNASLAQTVLSKAPAAPASKFDQLLQQKGQEQQQGAPAPQAAPGPDTSKFDRLLQQKAAEQSQPAPSQAPDPSVVSVGPTPGATPPPAPPPPARGPLPAVSVGPDAYQTPSPTADNPVSRIAGAATQAYEATPPVLTPQARADLERTWGGKYLVSPLYQAGGAILGAGNALGAGISQGALEASKAVTGDEAAGREANLLMQSAPGMAELANPLVAGRAAEAAAIPPATPRFAGEYAGEAAPGTTLSRISGAITSADTTPEGAVPTLAERQAARENVLIPQAQPGSVGAAGTPHTLSGISPAEAQMYRSTQEGQKLLENQQIGYPDRTQYVPNSNPNLAEQEQTVNTSREMKSLGATSTEASQAAKQAAEANNDARRQYWEGIRGSDADAFHEKAAQQTDINAQKQQVFAPTNVKGNVGMAPVIQQIDNVLSQPVNLENTPLQTVLGQLRQRLTDANGDPRAMSPEQAWGLRQDIDRMTDRNMKADDPNLHYVAHDLNNVSGVIDNGIEAQAPGYSDMLQTYQDHARRLDEMELLKKAEQGGTLFRGTGQTMNYSDFQRFMTNVVKARSTPSFDLNPYKSITDDTMTKLWNLRDDLRRSAGANELAKAPGSDTVPNIIDALTQYAKLGGMGAVDAVAEHFLPIVGPMALRGIKAAVQPGMARRAAARTMGRMQQFLTPGNPLTLPPSAVGNPLTGGPAP